jgi:hypothetical protein
VSYKKEEHLLLFKDLFKLSPIDWLDTKEVQYFRFMLDRCTKSYSKLNYEEQGWVSEQILIWYVTDFPNKS